VDAHIQARHTRRVARRRQAALGGLGALVAAAAVTLVFVATRPNESAVNIGPAGTGTTASTASAGPTSSALGSTTTSTPTGSTPTTTPFVPQPPAAPMSRVIDLDFTTSSDGWAIGHGRTCGACIVLAHTTDGGATWRSQAGPNVDAQHVRAGGDGTLYVYGPDLAVSRDDGASWSTALADVEVVEPEPKDVWAIVSCARPCDGSLTLERSTDRGLTWAKAALPAGAKGDHVELVRYQDGEAWLLVSDSESGTVSLWATVDIRRPWELLPVPCGADVARAATFTVVASNDLWLGCGGDLATVQQGKQVFHSEDGGHSWKDTPPLELSGHLGSVGAPDEFHAFLALGRGGLLSYTVGDPLWTEVIHSNDVCDSGLGPVRFVDPTHGWVGGGGPNCDKPIVWRTADRGATWHPVPVS
jgi:photosystem II stability/assembly factor-like uncharacterized protein